MDSDLESRIDKNPSAIYYLRIHELLYKLCNHNATIEEVYVEIKQIINNVRKESVGESIEA